MLAEIFREYHVEMWVSLLTLIICSSWTFTTKKAWNKIKEMVDRDKHSKIGTMSLLHDRLYQAIKFYMRIGATTFEDYENLNYMYTEYEALGGNGAGKKLWNEYEKLPIVTQEEFNKLYESKKAICYPVVDER
jgi:hypothetical protein